MMNQGKKYRHIFFDLDHTLWDFESNALDTFREMYEIYELQAAGIDEFDKFYRDYQRINHDLWELYKKDQISKEDLRIERFSKVLRESGVEDAELARKLDHHYVSESPKKKKLFPGTHEVLTDLQRRYKLHIITNGFEEVQHVKLESSDLGKYFEAIITSEQAGVKKPETGIFHYALREAGAVAAESLMIGDNIEVDILGARDAGIDQVLVHSNGHAGCPATWCCQGLPELLEIV